MYTSESARKKLPANYREYFMSMIEKHKIDIVAVGKAFKEIKKDWPAIKAKIAKKNGKAATASTMFAFGDEDESEEDENTIFARDLDVDLLLSNSSVYNYLVEAYDAEQDYDGFESTSSEASREARKLKLKYFGYGKWGDASSRKVLYHTIHGKLVPVKAAKQVKGAVAALKKLEKAVDKHANTWAKHTDKSEKAAAKGDTKKQEYHAKMADKASVKIEKVYDKQRKIIKGVTDNKEVPENLATKVAFHKGGALRRHKASYYTD